MNYRNQISKNNAWVKDFLLSIYSLMESANYDEAMLHLHRAGNFAWLHSCGQLAFIEIEDLIVRLSEVLPTILATQALAAQPFVATVLTSVHAAGGHSRLAWRWIQLDKSRLHHIILTGQGNNPIPEQVQDLVDSGRATLTLLDTEPSLWGRAIRLRQLLTFAEAVVLHIHPDDPIAPVALARMPTARPVLFVDHASHVFWMGSCAANLVLTLHSEACRTTATRRGVPATHIYWWPLYFDLTRLDGLPQLPIRERLKIPPDAVVLLTSGWPYKYHAIEGLSFSMAIAPVLLSRSNTHLIAVGPTAEDSAWKDLLLSFPDRIHLLGIQDEHFMTSCYHACDVYLDSIPFSSGSALTEAAALGKPIIKFATQEMRDGGFAADLDAIPLPSYNWTDLDSYRNSLLSLIDMPSSERIKLGSIFSSSVRNWHSEDVCRFFLESAYRQAKNCSRIHLVGDLVKEQFEPLDRLLMALGDNCRRCLGEVLETAPDEPEVVFSYASLLQSARLELAHPLVNQLIAKRHTVHISVIVIFGGNQSELDKTLASISQQIRSADTVEVIPAGKQLGLQPIGDNAQWTLVLCDGDILENDSLLLLEKALQRSCTEDTLLLYFDHDEINEHGQYDCPHLKPDFNHDLLLSYPYIGRAVLVRTTWLARCLSSASAPLASLPLAYWLALRALAEVGAKGFLHLPAVLAHLAAAEPAVFASTTEQWQALANILAVHLEAVAPGAQIIEGPGPGTFKVVYPLVQAPLVTIVIPTRDQLALLSRCIVSFFQNTNYPNFEVVVVDNDSQTPEAQEFLSGLGQMASGRARVLRAPGKFNFSRMNNLAAQQANGEFLLLLNNDTAAVQPDWLSHMVRNALRDNVGVVGARLLYPDDTLQHAGVILGLRGPADHPCIGIPADGAGYLYRAQVQQDFSAVTAACLLVRKSLYLKLGGLDETSFAVSYNDVDFCLRVGQTGQRIVWTPLATLLHEGSASQKSNVEGTSESNKLARFATERAAMYARWPEQIANDPAFNPNLSRRKLGYELEESNPLLRFDKLQGLTAHRVLALPCDADGCGQYRVLQPMQAMLEAGLCTGGSLREAFAPNLVLRSGADTLVVQRVDNDFGLDFLESVRALKGVKKIYEVDDHPSKVRLTNEAHKLLPKDMRGRVAKAIGLCDRLVVSTPPLARALASYNSDIRVVPNRLPPAMWGATPPQKRLIQEVAQRKPKVGWAGGIGHAADLIMIEAVIKEFSDRVDWVFIGVVPDSIRKYLKGYLSGVPTLKYPDLMMAQDWDLAIAPLELHEFNECKSNLKLLEYGWCGIPVVCSDITPYQCGLHVTRVKNRFKDWRNAIAERIADLEACHRDGLVLQQQIATDWTLQGEHVLHWHKAWTD